LNCGIAFGSIAWKDVEVFQDALLVENRRVPWKGKTLIDLWNDNFCPIHSMMLDREEIDRDDLWFDESLCKVEDYDFLLRISAKYAASFRLVGTFIGDYYIKNDGSNTFAGNASRDEDHMKDWMRSIEAIRKRKSTCLISPVVQRQLGMFPAVPNMTIDTMLTQLTS
jgi:hypothetical protein